MDSSIFPIPLISSISPIPFKKYNEINLGFMIYYLLILYY